MSGEWNEGTGPFSRGATCHAHAQEWRVTDAPASQTEPCRGHHDRQDYGSLGSWSCKLISIWSAHAHVELKYCVYFGVLM